MQKGWYLNLLKIVKRAYLKISEVNFYYIKLLQNRNLYLNLLKSLLFAQFLLK